jgi:hypothetical protein
MDRLIMFTAFFVMCFSCNNQRTCEKQSAKIDSIQVIVDSLEHQHFMLKKPFLILPPRPIHVGDSVCAKFYLAAFNKYHAPKVEVDSIFGEVTLGEGGYIPMVNFVARDTGIQIITGTMFEEVPIGELHFPFEMEYYVESQ